MDLIEVEKRYRNLQTAIVHLARSWRGLNTFINTIPDLPGIDSEQLMAAKLELDKMKRIFDAVIRMLDKKVE